MRNIAVTVYTVYSYMKNSTKPIQCHIPADGILDGHCCENLKSYIFIGDPLNYAAEWNINTEAPLASRTF
jgi:hypothetical protein